MHSPAGSDHNRLRTYISELLLPFWYYTRIAKHTWKQMDLRPPKTVPATPTPPLNGNANKKLCR